MARYFSESAGSPKEKRYHTQWNNSNLIRNLRQALTASDSCHLQKSSGPTSEVWHFESGHLAHLSVHLQVASATKPRSMLSSFPRRERGTIVIGFNFLCLSVAPALRSFLIPKLYSEQSYTRVRAVEL
ncbi:uncharacterized protein LOC105432354 [Pogonomyrmex barbatus]|uniref:Uncharacterized protein LOC105432354 n=1 Tax=Pogonomyrmex barbatus TaxID=144034 RepID=A0A6I9WZ67_9HYME|nr:uncharacterized protein LOC105432354 [Pogonomyrmex barbatus]